MEIIGYPNYTITNDGVITSKRIRTPQINKDGYHMIKLFSNENRIIFSVHRLVYQHYGTDFDPTLTIDHIDGNKNNNHISNLRMATRQEQIFNTKVRKNNILGVKGVQKHGNKYRATINIDGKRIRLGTFDTIEEARQAYETKAQELHGEFYRQ
jgi:hypothetical protein